MEQPANDNARNLIRPNVDAWKRKAEQDESSEQSNDSLEIANKIFEMYAGNQDALAHAQSMNLIEDRAVIEEALKSIRKNWDGFQPSFKLAVALTYFKIAR